MKQYLMVIDKSSMFCVCVCGGRGGVVGGGGGEGCVNACEGIGRK